MILCNKFCLIRLPPPAASRLPYRVEKTASRFQIPQLRPLSSFLWGSSPSHTNNPPCQISYCMFMSRREVLVCSINMISSKKGYRASFGPRANILLDKWGKSFNIFLTKNSFKIKFYFNCARELRPELSQELSPPFIRIKPGIKLKFHPRLPFWGP